MIYYILFSFKFWCNFPLRRLRWRRNM